MRTTLILTVVAIAGSMLLRDPAISLGVVLGSVIAAANFLALRKIVAALLASAGAGQKKPALLGVLLSLKFGVLAATLYLVVKYLPVQPLALLLGISVVVLAIFFEGIRAALRGSSAHPE